MAYQLLISLLITILIPVNAWAAAVDLQQMLVTLKSQLPSLELLFSGAAYLLGTGFVMAAVYQLRIYGESRMMMPGHTNLYKPVATMVSGAMLIYLPTTYQIFLTSIFGSATISPLDYQSNEQQWVLLAEVAVYIIKLVGIVAFIKGWVILARGGQSGGQQSTLGKAFTHIIGGTLALNVVAVQNILFTSIGLR